MGIGRFFEVGKAVFDGIRLSKNVERSPEFIHDLQTKRLKQLVTKAYNETAFYREKYDKHGVCPADIQSVNDITKLPLVTKQELVDHFERVTPTSLDRAKATMMGTSGSTGKPLQVYKDRMWFAHFFGFGFHMRKAHHMGLPKIGFILDIGSSQSIENQITEYSVWFTDYFALGTLILPVELEIVEIMERLEKSNVRYVCTYTGIMRELATLRKNGRGQKLKLKKIGLTGEILDDYTRAYVEEAFDCPCYSAYLSTEAGPIAMECEHKKMHVYSDACIVEVVDNHGEPRPRGEDGTLVLTCPIEGNSTPIIRYTGCADVGRLLDEECDCGINTPILGPIMGRVTDSIRLPSGKIYHAFSMTIPMEKIQRQFGKDRIRQYQIVQQAIDSIVISIVRNAEKAGPDDTLDDLRKIIEERYKKQLGDDIAIEAKEVLALPKTNNMGMPTPLVVSKIGNGAHPS